MPNLKHLKHCDHSQQLTEKTVKVIVHRYQSIYLNHINS